MLTFFPEIALHITRGGGWDNDHVVLFDDETKEIAERDRALRRLSSLRLRSITLTRPLTVSARG